MASATNAPGAPPRRGTSTTATVTKSGHVSRKRRASPRHPPAPRADAGGPTARPGHAGDHVHYQRDAKRAAGSSGGRDELDDASEDEASDASEESDAETDDGLSSNGPSSIDDDPSESSAGPRDQGPSSATSPRETPRRNAFPLGFFGFFARDVSLAAASRTSTSAVVGGNAFSSRSNSSHRAASSPPARRVARHRRQRALDLGLGVGAVGGAELARRRV